MKFLLRVGYSHILCLHLSLIGIYNQAIEDFKLIDPFSDFGIDKDADDENFDASKQVSALL